jgi:ArsR family transcriptional regulator
MNIRSHKQISCARPQIEAAAELFKCMGEPTRLELLCLLMQEELPVGELARRLNHTSSAVSHQLRLLRSLRLVKARRDGRSIFYSLDDDHVAEIISSAVLHSHEGEPGR